MWDRWLGAMPPTYRTLLAYALSAINGVIAVIFWVIGASFVIACVTHVMSLGPLDQVRDFTDPSTQALARVLGLGHPMLVATAALVLGLCVLLAQQVISIAAHALEKRIRTFGSVPVELKAKSVVDYGPGHLTEDEVKRIKERMLKSYGEEAHHDMVSFVVSAPDSERKREELLKQYWTIEQALKGANRKRCTFFSADVVGSTRMKNEQSEAAVKATFHAYEMMLKKIFADYSAWKKAWTPDGVMICFLDRELALGAARRLLENLPRFNATFNKLPVPFQVRCGLNEGELSIYEDSALERIADKVIDVAGHMQKHAPADTLLVGAHVYQALADKTGFVRSDLVVDGYETYAWRLVAHGGGS